MQWEVAHGDILDVEADVLVCSGNPQLNLSGGVGGAFLLKYGPAMQEALHGYLRATGRRVVPPGSLVEMPPCGSPYQAVLHAIAVDGAYRSSSEVVRKLVHTALEAAARYGATSLALPSLATGYGPLSIDEFLAAIAPLTKRSYPPLDRILLCLSKSEQADAAREMLFGSK